MRVFLAVKVPLEISKELYKLKRELQLCGKVNFVPPENFHYNFRFFGEIDEKKFEEISSCVSKVSSIFSPFEIFIKGAGVFPSLSSPRVVWLGMEDDGTFLSLYSSLSDCFEEIGIPPEGRKFTPHLTLGRIKYLERKDVIRNFVEKYKSKVFAKFKVSKITLFKSTLRREGPIYEILREFELK